MKMFTQSQIRELDDRELMQHCRIVGENARKWKNYFVAMLPEIERRDLYKRHFTSIYEYATKVGGVGKQSVRAVLKIEKKLEDKPDLKKLIPIVGLNKVRVVAGIATQENQKELAQKVTTLTKGALELFA